MTEEERLQLNGMLTEVAALLGAVLPPDIATTILIYKKRDPNMVIGLSGIPPVETIKLLKRFMEIMSRQKLVLIAVEKNKNGIPSPFYASPNGGDKAP